MLRVKTGVGEICVSFMHTFLEPKELEDLTGESFDFGRHCSFAEISELGCRRGFGMSICHPKDNFSKSAGRKRALANALLAYPKDVRRSVWETYMDNCKF